MIRLPSWYLHNHPEQVLEIANADGRVQIVREDGTDGIIIHGTKIGVGVEDKNIKDIKCPHCGGLFSEDNL